MIIPANWPGYKASNNNNLKQVIGLKVGAAAGGRKKERKGEEVQFVDHSFQPLPFPFLLQVLTKELEEGNEFKRKM
ncbi:unnamed protein product [Linum trigynum]|uniref:Uncharacterized protein n=1 Tax=Linum trigynum TaxID=586398 RepID=A0AAV2D4K7_9ROSI